MKSIMLSLIMKWKNLSVINAKVAIFEDFFDDYMILMIYYLRLIIFRLGSIKLQWIPNFSSAEKFEPQTLG